MGAFEYKALDARGRERKGTLEGDTPRSVRQMLREQGLTPLEVSAAAESERGSGQRGLDLRYKGGISASDLAQLTRQLSTLIQAALPIDEALQVVARQTEKPRISNILLAIRARVMEGHSLAYGLGEYPRVFPEIFRVAIAAGEQTGHLDAVLNNLADYAEKREAIQQKISVALIYPTILVGMSFLIIALLLAYVVPQVVTVFAQQEAQLPLLTRILISTSDFLRNWWWALLIVVVSSVLGIRRLLKEHSWRTRYHDFLLRAPVFGKLVRAANGGRFARTLAILSGSGVPILEGLRISEQVIKNEPMKQAVAEATIRIREGTPISKAIGQTKRFPPMMVHLIASGESSGKLEEMLGRAADSQERDLETKLAKFLGLLEPLIILLMGGMVMVIVLAILLPIFQLNSLVGR